MQRPRAPGAGVTRARGIAFGGASTPHIRHSAPAVQRLHESVALQYAFRQLHRCGPQPVVMFVAELLDERGIDPQGAGFRSLTAHAGSGHRPRLGRRFSVGAARGGAAVMDRQPQDQPELRRLNPAPRARGADAAARRGVCIRRQCSSRLMGARSLSADNRGKTP
jgi:hypothetical protein